MVSSLQGVKEFNLIYSRMVERERWVSIIANLHHKKMNLASFLFQKVIELSILGWAQPKIYHHKGPRSNCITSKEEYINKE